MRWTFSAVFGLFAVAAALAPVLASQGRLEAAILYAGFHPFCHQQVDRLWIVAGEPLAVCVRCFGVYLGIVAGGLVVVPLGSRRAILAAAAVCLASWALEVTGVFWLPVVWRFVTGLLVGVTVGRAIASGLAASTPGEAGAVP